MTLAHVRLRVPSATGEAPSAGMLTCTPLRRRHLEDLDRIVLPASFRVVLDEVGEVDIELAPTGPDWCWQIREDVRAGIIRYVLVPDQAEVDYGDLADIDPTTLDPATPASPAWLGQLANEAAERAAADVALGLRIDSLPAGVPTYLQQTQPDGPAVWYQTDTLGRVIDIRTVDA